MKPLHIGLLAALALVVVWLVMRRAGKKPPPPPPGPPYPPGPDPPGPDPPSPFVGRWRNPGPMRLEITGLPPNLMLVLMVADQPDSATRFPGVVNAQGELVCDTRDGAMVLRLAGDSLRVYLAGSSEAAVYTRAA